MPCSFRACSGRSATWLSTLAGTRRTSWGCYWLFVSFIRRGKSTPRRRKPACAREGNPRKPKPTGRCRGGVPRHFLGSTAIRTRSDKRGGVIGQVRRHCVEGVHAAKFHRYLADNLPPLSYQYLRKNEQWRP